jgi:hypothetical protein
MASDEAIACALVPISKVVSRMTTVVEILAFTVADLSRICRCATNEAGRAFSLGIVDSAFRGAKVSTFDKVGVKWCGLSCETEQRDGEEA